MKHCLLIVCCLLLTSRAQADFRNDSLFLRALESGNPDRIGHWFYPEKMAEDLFWNKYLHTQAEFAEKGEKKMSRKQFAAAFKKNESYRKEKEAFDHQVRALQKSGFYFSNPCKWKLIARVRADELFKKSPSFSVQFSKDFLKNIFYETYEAEHEKKCARIDIGVIAGENGNKYFFENKICILPVLNKSDLYEMFIGVLAESRGYNPFLVIDAKTTSDTTLREFCIDTRTFLYFRSNYSHLPSDPEKIKALFPDRTITVDSLQMLFLEKEFGCFQPEIISNLDAAFASCRTSPEMADLLNKGALAYPDRQKEEIRKWAYRLFLSGIMCEENSFRQKNSDENFIPLRFIPE